MAPIRMPTSETVVMTVASAFPIPTCWVSRIEGSEALSAMMSKPSSVTVVQQRTRIQFAVEALSRVSEGAVCPDMGVLLVRWGVRSGAPSTSGRAWWDRCRPG